MSVAIASSSKPEVEKKKKKSKSKDKDKYKSAEFIDDVDDAMDGGGPSGSTSTGYRPPEGMVVYTEYLDSPEFDYDQLKSNDNLELWIIKAPSDVKPKVFNNLKLSVPSSAASSQIGSLSRKSTTYDVWSVKEKSQMIASQAIAGGDDLHGLTCLVPRKKKGHLVMAPKPFEHHIVIAGHAALPTPPTSSPEAPEPTFMQDPERYRHPLDSLKHRFLPIGSTDATGTKLTTLSDENDTAMAVDGKDATAPSTPAKSPKKSQEEKEKTKEKKRKVGSATEPSKKTKKSKTES